MAGRRPWNTRPQPETESKTPRNDDGDLFCRKCGNFLARNFDDVCLLIGGAKMFGSLKMFCAVCGKVHHWEERAPIENGKLDEPTLEILHSLGNGKYQRRNDDDEIEN